ncbi:hypothetical protein QQM79_13010 [Marinobacteraceae bacterium S3BR75-40.1]
MVLKSLWRRQPKQQDDLPREHVPQPTGPQEADTISSQLTHTSEFHLERLEKLIELRYRKSLEGSGDESLRELVRFASRLQDQDIQRELLLFYLNCPPAVQVFLRSGDTVEATHYIHQAPNPDSE